MINECVTQNQWIAGVGTSTTQDDLATSTVICTNQLQSFILLIFIVALFIGGSWWWMKQLKK